MQELHPIGVGSSDALRNTAFFCLQMFEPASVAVMARLVVVVMCTGVMVFNLLVHHFAGLFSDMHNASLAADVATIMHSVEARSCQEEERAQQQYDTIEEKSFHSFCY